MIRINLLKNHQDTIAVLSHIWHKGLGEKWMPEIGPEALSIRSTTNFTTWSKY